MDPVYKQKIELQLERKQVFFIVFTAVAVASVVFALGVIIGKRAESATQTQTQGDSFASLGQSSAQCPEPAAISTLLSEAQSEKADTDTAAATPDQQALAPAVETVEPASAPIPSAPTGDGKFTLQISSFQERRDAEDFYREMTKVGVKPFIVKAAVEGKGTWFRVRVGAFPTYEAALAAKKDFESTHNRIAYVTRLPKQVTSSSADS